MADMQVLENQDEAKGHVRLLSLKRGPGNTVECGIYREQGCGQHSKGSVHMGSPDPLDPLLCICLHIQFYHISRKYKNVCIKKVLCVPFVMFNILNSTIYHVNTGMCVYKYSSLFLL